MAVRRLNPKSLSFLSLLLLFSIASAKVFFEERFEGFMLIAIVNGDGWENRWVKSDWKKDENMAGRWR
ncbi:hypothetical protein HanXRQr2_Chr17g0798301 [Helianthus annuus]|uniref:Uncharacterized protein n=1 Tax=Helianthus annuus TaxID=4232 RepID=A0A9K3DGS0_HELAN|nr:hypothetical protein HanXRQr2_Chr17g0798301 [Helianthus annuus]